MDPSFSIKDYLMTKDFKMSDAYSVEVIDREPGNDNNLMRYFTDQDIAAYGIGNSNDEDGTKKRKFCFKNCMGFTPPVYKPEAEDIKFCNTTRKVYLPNKAKPDPVEFKFHETERQYATKFIKYCLAKNFYDENIDQSKDSYNPYRYIDEINIYVWDNTLSKIVMAHKFGSCRIVAYDYGHNLSYDSSSFLQPSISFSFLSYKIDTNP